MSGFRDEVPAYQTIRVSVPETPVGELTDIEAWQARERYPSLGASGPVFGVVRERDEGGWELQPYFGVTEPQEARDSMAPDFRRMAQQAEQAGDQATHDECMRVAVRLDREPINEVTVLGTRYRVVRADQFVRTGPNGPEPPRPTDPDPGEPDMTSELPDPAAGFVIDTVVPTGLSVGILKLELLQFMYKEGSVEPEVRADAKAAQWTHPGGVLLPPAFIVAERVNGKWGPGLGSSSRSPQAARDALAGYLRVYLPWQLDLDEGRRVEYNAVADRLNDERVDSVSVGGRRFRVVRVERLVRVGPDGPEGPRPSDPDTLPPPWVQMQEAREQGLISDDDDEDAPIELTEEDKRFARFVNEDEERRLARIERRRARRTQS